MFGPAFLGAVRMAPKMGQQYSWNQFVQPISGGPSWGGMPAPEGAPAGKSDVHCYHCDNPAMFGYLSEAQAEQWNERFNRNCQKSPESECRDSAPPAPTAYGGLIPDLFSKSGAGSYSPQEFSMTGRIPTRPIGRFY